MSPLAEEVRARRALPPPAMRRFIREQAKVSQRRAAAEMSVAHTTFARWESGEAEPRSDHAIAYEQLLRDLQAVISS
jgi:DNA-binding transcriptional regulator YiaG